MLARPPRRIDTPGVIRRVSTLFRGYNMLILGFNTFLPEGYKIELKDIEAIERDRLAQQQQQEQQQQQQQQAPHDLVGAGGAAGEYMRGNPAHGGQPGGMAVHQQGGLRGMGGQGGYGSAMGVPPHMKRMGPGGPGHHEMGGPPPGAMMGGGPAHRGPVGSGGQEDPHGGGMGVPHGMHGRPMGGMHGGPGGMIAGGHPGMEGPMKAEEDRRMAQGGGGGPMGAPAQSAQMMDRGNGQPVEFDHAINYVTVIKKRFESDPDTYKTFLEILHTYQREQRGIKEVLDQVSELFRDHPDLLKEFTYFLPDAVQEQAKERLARAAHEAELRSQRRQMEGAAADGYYGGGARGARGGRYHPRGGAYYGEEGMDVEGGPEAEAYGGGGGGHARGKKHSRGRKSGPRADEQAYYSRSAERDFFERVKASLSGSGAPRDGWAQFLKILALFSQEVLTRPELHQLASQLLGDHADLLVELKRLLQARSLPVKKGGGGGKGAARGGIAPEPWYGMAVSDVDFSQCRRCTPSYRALPPYFPKPPCSQRSAQEAGVLNDAWVSVPVGSEENYSFKHMRRNTYEETLFKCEDERFEIDMVIDSNASTIRVLEPLAEEIAALRGADGDGAKAAGAFQYKLDPRTLSRVHHNAISRIYGEHGPEILELLRANPAGAVPVLLKRLKQKDIEWRRARQELARQWKGLMEANFHKSLDHRSYYFKTSDKRQISIRALVSEIADAREQRLAGNAPPAAAAPRRAPRRRRPPPPRPRRTPPRRPRPPPPTRPPRTAPPARRARRPSRPRRARASAPRSPTRPRPPPRRAPPRARARTGRCRRSSCPSPAARRTSGCRTGGPCPASRRCSRAARRRRRPGRRRARGSATGTRSSSSRSRRSAGTTARRTRRRSTRSGATSSRRCCACPRRGSRRPGRCSARRCRRRRTWSGRRGRCPPAPR